MSAAGLAGRWHVHGCTDCGARYEDSCGDVDTNARCETCRLGYARSFDTGQWDPRPCCMEARTINYAEQRLSLRLAGDAPWFRCDECARTFTVHPRDRTVIDCEQCDRTVPHTHRTRRDHEQPVSRA